MLLKVNGLVQNPISNIICTNSKSRPILLGLKAIFENFFIFALSFLGKIITQNTLFGPCEYETNICIDKLSSKTLSKTLIPFFV